MGRWPVLAAPRVSAQQRSPFLRRQRHRHCRLPREGVINILPAAGIDLDVNQLFTRRRFVATIDQMVPAVFLDQLMGAPDIGFPHFGLFDD